MFINTSNKKSSGKGFIGFDIVITPQTDKKEKKEKEKKEKEDSAFDAEEDKLEGEED